MPVRCRPRCSQVLRRSILRPALRAAGQCCVLRKMRFIRLAARHLFSGLLRFRRAGLPRRCDEAFAAHGFHQGADFR